MDETGKKGAWPLFLAEGVDASANDVYANPPDVDVLDLEPGHPGLGDAAYVSRRRDLFATCRAARLAGEPPPLVDYSPEEQRIWREVTPKLDELHEQHASSLYLDAKRELGISEHGIPQLRHLSVHLQRVSGVHLVPAEGPIPYRTFYRYIAEHGFPCTQFIRHGSKPEFTPEPDMIHDCLGHVPPLLDADYSALLALIGRAAVEAATGDQVLALKRLSWFSIEFGLIAEAGETKVFGAGILSSIGEIPNSLFSKDVERRPFVTREVIETDYDPSRMQDLLFVLPSLPFLRREVEQLVAGFGVRP
jgi:phenylalanine-4-hydroxylase